MVKNKGVPFASKELEELKRNGLFKTIKTLQSDVKSEVKVDGKKVLNFCSNNYLGLANDKRLKKAAIRAIEKYGVGPAAVRTISGTMDLHLKLEEKLAKFKKSQSVISLQSGLLANIAAIPVLAGEGDIIFSDELNHASIIDGCRLSKAQIIRFKHADMEDLEQVLKKCPKGKGKKWVVTDGVFSMDGDIAPLDGIYKLAQKYGAFVYVDDAHGEGVLGKNGRGIVDHFNLHGKVDVEIGTLSKAFGVVGGFVSGKREMIELLRQKARPFLFSSASTPADVAASIAAVDILEKSDSLVKKLWKNTDYFKRKMSGFGFDIGNSVTPIVPVMLGDVKLAAEFSKRLFESGVYAVAIGYPTVPLDKARIRVMNSASHSKKDLDKALQVFEKVGKKFSVI